MISAISHDANTYLTVVKGEIDNLLVRLRRNLALEEPAAHLALAAAYAEVLGCLLENLKDYEKLVEGKMEVVLAAEDPQALLKSVRDSAENEARRRRQQVILEAAPAECRVRADNFLLRRVLQNLVQNALKFSPEGSCVRLWVVPEAERVRLLVADEGAGIPESAWESVFEPYLRLNTAVKGTGLGLAIARQLMQLMNGSLAVVASTPGNGTTFAVTIPRVE